MTKLFKMSLLGAAMLALAPVKSFAVTISLPEVESCGPLIQYYLGGLDTADAGIAPDNLQCLKGTVTATSPGTYVASFHDEYLSYSIQALETIQQEQSHLPIAQQYLPIDVYGDYQKLVSGSGTFDVGIYVKANGSGVLNNNPPYPDALPTVTTETSYTGTWGGNTADPLNADTKDKGEPNPNVPDTVLTVGEVVDWMGENGNMLFFMDLADPQNATTADMWFSGRTYVTDSTGNTVKDTWAIDNDFDGNFEPWADPQDDTADKAFMVMAPHDVPVYIPGSGCTPTGAFAQLGADWCMIANNRGSGKPEFMALAPSMNLYKMLVVDKTLQRNDLFWGNFKIIDESAADEEIYMSLLKGTTTVPEPGVLGLLGLGLLGLGLARRRTAK